MKKPEELLHDFLTAIPGLKTACDKDPATVARVRKIFLAGVASGASAMVKEMAAEGPAGAAMAALNLCSQICELLSRDAGEEDVAESAPH